MAICTRPNRFQQWGCLPRRCGYVDDSLVGGFSASGSVVESLDGSLAALSLTVDRRRPEGRCRSRAERDSERRESGFTVKENCEATVDAVDRRRRPPDGICRTQTDSASWSSPSVTTEHDSDDRPDATLTADALSTDARLPPFISSMTLSGFDSFRRLVDPERDVIVFGFPCRGRLWGMAWRDVCAQRPPVTPGLTGLDLIVDYEYWPMGAAGRPKRTGRRLPTQEQCPGLSGTR